MAAMGELEFDLADQAFRRAMELSATDVQMLILLAQQYQRLRRLDQARRCFELAVAADPTSAHAQISLALWHEKDRQLDKAWECVEACVAASSARRLRNLCQGAAAASERTECGSRNFVARFDPAAIRRSEVRISSRHLLAEILDEAGQYAEAFRELLEAKNFARQTANMAQLEQDYDRAAAAAANCWRR